MINQELMCTGKILLTFLFSAFACFRAIASDDSLLTNVFVKCKPGLGVIIRHRESMGNLVGHVPSLQLEIGRQTFGREPWEQLYRYPEYGAGYYFADLGNPSLLGHVNAVYLYLNTPAFRSSCFNLNYHIAIGLSYLTKKWDYKKNNENLAIGTHLNVYFNLELNSSFRISKQLELTAGIGACHYSNGAVAQPNLGINVSNVTAGLKYYFNEMKPGKNTLAVPETKKMNEYTVIVASGMKTVPPLMGPKYFMATASLYFARQTSYKRKIGIGADLFYDESLYAEPGDSSDVPFVSVLRSGVYLSHEFLIKKLSIALQLGAYTYYRFSPRFPLYTRLALRYHLTPRIFANVSLKAHVGVADFIEWGIGYRVYRK